MVRGTVYESCLGGGLAFSGSHLAPWIFLEISCVTEGIKHFSEGGVCSRSQDSVYFVQILQTLQLSFCLLVLFSWSTCRYLFSFSTVVLRQETKCLPLALIERQHPVLGTATDTAGVGILWPTIVSQQAVDGQWFPHSLVAWNDACAYVAEFGVRFEPTYRKFWVESITKGVLKCQEEGNNVNMTHRHTKSLENVQTMTILC